MTPDSPEISVIIISLGADPLLADAVKSIQAQGVPCEIIVANSGGGDVRSVLGRDAEHVTIVECQERLFAGGARNLGLKAATSPYIAFLACDCLAAPGWLRHRLRRHRKGAAAVASAMLHDRPWNLVAWADHLLLFPRRLPHLHRSRALRYSVSFERALIDRRGLFDDTLRIGEDTEYLTRLSGKERPAWAPGVVTIHRNNTRLADFVRDQYRRGRRFGSASYSVLKSNPQRLFRSTLRAARQVPGLAIRGLRGRDRVLAIASLPIYAIGLAARLYGIRSASKRERGNG